MKKLLFGIAILAIAVMSQAQRGGGGLQFGGGPGGGGKLALLAREDVKADLALTDDQNDKIKAANPMTAGGDRQAMMAYFQEMMKEAGLADFQEMQTEEGRKKFTAVMTKRMAEVQKKVEAVLTPEQAKRLSEINIQFYGNRVVTQPEIGKAVGMTEEQNKKIADLTKAQQDAMRGLFQQVQSGELTREDMQEKQKKNGEILDSEIGKLLTDKQKAALKEMGGTKKFERKDEN